MLTSVYAISFYLSFLYLCIVLAIFKNKISPYYFMLFVTIMITNFGYMNMADSETLKMAIMANTTQYLGASFSTFFMLMCIADLCKFRVKTWLQVLLITLGVIIFIFAANPDLTDLYYKEIYLENAHGVPMLVKKYGPIHAFYPVYLVGTISYACWFILKSFTKGRDISYINSIMLVISMTAVFIAYGLEKLSGLGIPLVPIAYDFVETIVVILLAKISLYDISAISANYMAKNKITAFILCDSKGMYLGSDDTAKQWFPEINNLMVDCKIKDDSTPFLKQIIRWIYEGDKETTVFVKRNERIIEVTHSVLNQKVYKNLHCFYLRDDTKQQEYTKLVESYNEKLEKDVNAKTKNLRRIQNDIIISMASIVENRDSNTGGHIVRTSDVVRVFVNHLLEKKVVEGLTPEMAKCIIKAAPLHDFGKIGVPDVVLNKPGKFTDEEYEIMKKHPVKGAEIVERILNNADDPVFKNIAVNVAHYHHEKWDSKGYPSGMKDREIPIEARVMALADVFDALVSKRVYKEKLDYNTAFAIIEQSAGTHFDPVLTKAFLECRPKLEALYDSYPDE